MAFDNVTLFEVHLDDAKFSSVFGSEDARDEMAAEPVTEAETDEEMMGDEMMGDEMMGDEMMGDEMMDETFVAPSRGRGFARFVAVAAVVGIAYAVIRRRRGAKADAEVDEDAAHVETAADVEHVAVDEAAPR